MSLYEDAMPRCPKCNSQRWAGQAHVCQPVSSGIIGDDVLFGSAVREEIKRARKKFPSSVLSLAALTEEVGELAQAMLHARALKGHAGWNEAKMKVWNEAVQVATMAQRVAVEGDPSFDVVEYSEK